MPDYTINKNNQELELRLSGKASALPERNANGIVRTGDGRRIGRRRTQSEGIALYDLGYYKTGSEFVTVPLSVGGPLIREQASWADTVTAYNFPLSIPLDQWASVFKKMGREYTVSVEIMDSIGAEFTENLEFETEVYKLPEAAVGPPLVCRFRNVWLDEANAVHAYYENGLFAQMAIFGIGFDHYTELPNAGAPQVTPDLDIGKRINVYLPPAAIRITGEYYPDDPDGSGSATSGWRLLPYPQFKGEYGAVPADCPTMIGVPVYYRTVTFGTGIQFSLLAGGGVQPPFIVCGLGGSGADGQYPNLSPDKDEFNSPTVFWDRTAVFDNYLEGTREDNDEALRERMVSVIRSQGGANIERRSGIWNIGAVRDNMSASRINAGGHGSSEPFLFGAINQGSKWYFRWKNI